MSPLSLLRISPSYAHIQSQPHPLKIISSKFLLASDASPRLQLELAEARRFVGVVRSSGTGGESEQTKNAASVFLDEGGFVEDMDGYLDYLSLEYDSVWDTKPAWCQPWTILLTGTAVVASSWVVLHSLLITSGIVLLIGAWWYIFLYSYPKAYSEMIADRKKKVASGIEDTYGTKKSQ